MTASAAPFAVARTASKPAAARPQSGAHGPRLQIPSLDGLRAVSFLIVFTSHAGLDFFVPGGFGVTVFFFLSGYLITTLMRLEAEKTGGVSLANFYARRALRILPPFYIVLATATALAAAGFLRSDLTKAGVVAQFGHLTNYWMARHGGEGIPSGTGVYWSLAVEEHFYLLFPAVFLLLGRLRLSGKQKALVFWGLCGAVLLWRYALVLGLHASVDRLSMASDTRIDSIAFGCALAVWNNPVLDAPRTSMSDAAWTRWVTAPALLVLLSTFVLRGPVFRETLRYTLQGAALTPLFVTAIRFPDHPLLRPLNTKPVRFVGTLSYSLYLVHHVVLKLFLQHTALGGLARGVLALAVSFAVSWAMYVVVERPCARLRHGLERARPAAGGLAGVAQNAVAGAARPTG